MTAKIVDGAAMGREIRAQAAAEARSSRPRAPFRGWRWCWWAATPPARCTCTARPARATRRGCTTASSTFPTPSPQDELFGAIDGLNADPAIHGMLVQLPLPPHIHPKAVLERVHPSKDVDGFHPLNVGRAFVGDPRGFVPATPAGIMELLRHERIETHGKHAVIVGRSLIVCKPLASLLMAPGPNATVTLAHRHTVDLASHTRMADILVVAVGKPGLITADMVKPGAAVFDVGTTRVPDARARQGLRDPRRRGLRRGGGGRGHITPVPGGVGPMTIAMLLRNTIEAARRFHHARTAASGGGPGRDQDPAKLSRAERAEPRRAMRASPRLRALCVRPICCRNVGSTGFRWGAKLPFRRFAVSHTRTFAPSHSPCGTCSPPPSPTVARASR